MGEGGGEEFEGAEGRSGGKREKGNCLSGFFLLPPLPPFSPLTSPLLPFFHPLIDLSLSNCMNNYMKGCWMGWGDRPGGEKWGLEGGVLKSLWDLKLKIRVRARV